MHAPWHQNFPGRQNPSTPARAQLSRRATLAGGAAAVCALAACGVDPQPEALSAAAPQADTPLRNVIDRGPAFTVAGEHLNVALLRRFYQLHGFEPVWPARQAQANSLVNAVLRAGDQGLDPERFHASRLRHRAALPPLDRDLLLSDSFLSYADALANGAVPIGRRGSDETLTHPPVDVAAVLDAVIDNPDPAAAIEALAPATPTYRALRRALQRYRPGALAGNEAAMDRRRTIAVNLERQRWLPRRPPADRVWVNVAAEQLIVYRADKPEFSTRVVVGEDAEPKQSPEFRATIDAAFFNPPWVIPSDIVTAEILPKISRDPDYLERNRMVLLAHGEAEQLPGPDAGLGLIMFDMPNKFDVYLHDTPDKDIFNRANRRISHGCIRVQDPRELASLLLRQPVETINQEIAVSGTTRHNLPVPVPVFVVYQTACLDSEGVLRFYPDFYHRDLAIWQKLQQPPQGPDATVHADNRPPSPARPSASRL